MLRMLGMNSMRTMKCINWAKILIEWKNYKYADKRLKFERTYIIRANIALLANFISNWQNLILIRLKIHTSEFYNLYEEV
jgi:hypothetical protein